ncbi:MAG: hypothetical protein D6696_07710 [Acidobacteria bacterium]|nr:MAG: hypothetical protein D6696_07710 [Acidobacteriota bacterium]
MRHRIIYLLLLLLKWLCRLFYRYDWHWVGDVPPDPWRDFRLIAILNHTSLFEFLLAGGAPRRLIWRIARHGVVPIAAKTMRRPIVGRLWRLVAGNVLSISRERDETWQQVLASIDPESMVVILPEGRMKRANGLDKDGKEMTVRSGIVDILEAIQEGDMLLVYSEGLHHIQAPGEPFPRLFKTIRVRLEVIDVRRYRERLRAAAPGPRAYRRAVVADLTRRRDLYCDPGFDARGCPPVRHDGSRISR